MAILINEEGLTADGWCFFILQAPLWFGAIFLRQEYLLSVFAFYGVIALIGEWGNGAV